MIPVAAVFLAIGAARAACPASAADVREEVEAGISAYESWAWEEFRSRLVRADRDVDCLSEVLPRPDVARLHLLHAMGAALEKDATAATRAFRGVLAASPAWSPPADVAAPGSLLHDAFDVAREAGVGGSTALRAGTWYVDGRASATTVPTDRTALVQKLVTGAELRSWYLDGNGVPDDMLPDVLPDVLPSRPPEPSPVATHVTTRSHRRHGSRGLAIAGGAVAVASGVGWGLAVVTHRSFGETLDPADAERLATLNHGAVVGAGLLGAGAGGLLVGALVKGEW